MHTAFQDFQLGKEAYLPDRAFISRMRALALEAEADGYCRIVPPAGAKRALRALRRSLEQTNGEERCSALQKAADCAGFFETAAFSPAPRGGMRLPAVSGEARVQRIAREILLHSDGAPSRQRLFDALNAFQEERSLRMEELVCIPDAVRAESLRLFCSAAMAAVRLQREREAAERWATGHGPLRTGSAFLEHALRVCREYDLPEKHAELQRAIPSADGGADGLVRRAHERQARLCMRLENLPAALRMPDSIDPDELLRISDAARLLFDLPAYAECSEESRSALRLYIGRIAHAAKLSEAAVVRAASELALTAARQNGARDDADPPGYTPASARQNSYQGDANPPEPAIHPARQNSAQDDAGPHKNALSLHAEPTFYWADDEGRRLLLHHLGRADVRMKRLVPDPKGTGYIACTGLIGLGLLVILRISGAPALPCAAVACWTIAAQAVAAACARLFPARCLLQLELKSVPAKMRTLVVIPAILPDPDRAAELVSQLEVLAAGEKDENIEFCLLGDHPDTDERSVSGDAAVLEAARKAIDLANLRIGRRRLYFLHRSRQYSAPSGKWMGHERKRGALNALNTLLLHGESMFDADGADAPALAGRFRYVITLDADTRPYPGALRRLIGTIAHPLSRLRGVNVLQPRMAQSAAGGPSPFVRFMSGGAGVSGYGGGCFELYQDLCGQGGFAGKGIYEISAFDRLAGHTLPDNSILSHDLLEGFLAGSAFASDIVLLDGFPRSLAAYFKRLHRWTRGDWQLLPLLPGRTPLQKYRMLDNLRASLAPLSALCLIASGLICKNMSAVAAGLLVVLSGPLFSLAGPEGWLRAAAQLSLLPNETLCRTDAAVRALYRTYRSRRGMLEWVSAADADRQAGKTPLWPRIAAAALCLIGGFSLPGLVFAALFLLGAPVLEKMETAPEKPGLSDSQRDFIARLARETWRFFAEHTCESGFPPDNVQFDPPRPAAKSTSPTNIGLYMVSCVSAEKLGLIGREEMLRRIETTVGSIERAEKWRGHLYNWYDPASCEPLRPLYVSSVDSGNLAASLLLCAQAVRVDSPALAARLETLAGDTDFSALYDPVRRLFRIGYDAESAALSESHYDLLASEARILSYTSILLGQAPVSHWKRLSRACVAAGHGAAPVSWSGTMFEYLMPELFFNTPAHSLLGEGCRMCVEEQKNRPVGGFWGISESGYYAFDARRSFQYRAFGVRALMLKDEPTGAVISPYASALALSIDPEAAAKNLHALHQAGFTTPCGLAEAIDFAPERLGGRDHGVVRSAMAHHQGMLLAACANALTGGAVRACFSERPDAKALLPLLEEAPVRRRNLPKRGPVRQNPAQRPAKARAAVARSAKPGQTPPDACLLSGGGSTLYLSADGAACLHSAGVRVNRFLSDPALADDGFFTHIRTNGEPRSLLDGSARFSAGSALFRSRIDPLDIRLHICISPEDGALLRQITLANPTDRPVRAQLRDLALLSLCRDAEADEHPAFHDLFLECSFPEPAMPGRAQGNVLRILRRPRGEEGVLTLDYSVCGLADGDRLVLCADAASMLPRGADPSCAQNVFAGRVRPGVPGAGIRPIQGACIDLTIPPRSQRRIGFASFVTRSPDRASLPDTDRYLDEEAFLRAQRLAEEQGISLLRFLDLPDRTAALYGRAASLCIYARPMRAAAQGRKEDSKISPQTMRAAVHSHEKAHEAYLSAAPEPSLGKEALWPMGISGDRPLLTAVVERSTASADELLRLHAYFSAMGFETDVLLLYDAASGYAQPMRDRLTARIEQARLHSGRVKLFSRTEPDERSLRAAERLSALYLQDGATLSALFSAPGSFRSPQKPRRTHIRVPEGGGVYGHFTEDAREYRISLRSGEQTPHAWSNILAGRTMGALATENGGGFLWYRNSRNARLTPFRNDPLSEGASIRIWLTGPDSRIDLMPRPADAPIEAAVRQGESEYILRQNGVTARIIRFTDPEQPLHAALLRIKSASAQKMQLHAACEWLMGVHPTDLRAVAISFTEDMQLAAGSISCVGCMRLPGAHPEGDHLAAELSLTPEKPFEAALIVSAADTAADAARLAREYDAEAGLCAAQAFWQDLLSRVRIETGDPAADAILSRWAPYQAIAARFLGRAGLYQSGGAYGFRDQMQDALCLSPIVPDWTRSHILLCAAHQFPEGDVQHWWHPPRTGVRTRISDDLLFLPYVTAKYVLETGDSAILDEPVPYLSGDELPENRHDLYYEAGVSSLCEPLREHCLRAVRRVSSMLGAHGLPLMGCGDWNDGMDRIGAQGRGESVWLAQFLSVTARAFAEICPEHEAELHKISQNMLSAIELHAWDGDRYLRAYRDDGSPLGSEATSGGCKIDALCQSWAVLAGCDPERTRVAMDTMWERLYDEKLRILRLLDPPFDGNIADTGYIAAYPPGIRENGGQYTHAACWALLAFAKMGDRTRAWTLLRALLPAAHADTREKADRYRVEPYALAADIYACGAGYAGRGGWTWYTGAAGWLFRSFLLGISGFERRGDRVRMCALLDEGMDEMRVVLRHGSSTYTLISARGENDCGWAALVDDGMPHELRFGAR